MSDLLYPKSSEVYFLERISELHRDVARLINEVTARDAQIAQMDAVIGDQIKKIAELTPPKPDENNSPNP